MTIALLDPAFFLNDRSDAELRHDLDTIVQTCRACSLRLPPIPEYWKPLQALARPLEQAGSPHTKRAFGEIWRLSARSPLVPDATGGHYWQKGFKVLFNTHLFPENQPWHSRMATAILRALAA